MLFFCNIASVSLYFGFGVPTTPIRLFDSYTTPLCKAPFRKNVPKLVQPGCSAADDVPKSPAEEPLRDAASLLLLPRPHCSLQ